MDKLIIPHTLVVAARTFRKNPRLVGEVLIALVEGSGGTGLSECQRFILASCRDELVDLQSRREAAAERKRRQRGVAK